LTYWSDVLSYFCLLDREGIEVLKIIPPSVLKKMLNACAYYLRSYFYEIFFNAFLKKVAGTGFGEYSQIRCFAVHRFLSDGKEKMSVCFIDLHHVVTAASSVYSIQMKF